MSILSAVEIAALDAAISYEQRVHANAVESGVFGQRCRENDRMQFDAVEVGGSVPGLVSVPTTQNRGRGFLEALVRGRRAALMQSVNAFEIDATARRLAVLRRSVGFAARGHCVSERGARDDEVLMVTLTYRGTNIDWHASHVRAFMDHVRKWCARRGIACRYVWVAELQKRGVIHYHVALWVPRGIRLPKPDDQGWWPHGMTRIEVARAAVPYLLKYLSKDTSKTFGRFPCGARIYGIGGQEHSLRRARRWLGLPGFVQANSSIADDWRRAPGGGWYAPNGSHWPSEFARVQVGGVSALMRRHRHPRSIEAAGPFNWRSPCCAGVIDECISEPA